MAHAQFHKGQRVYVRPVGTWAMVERVVPQWTKGLEEPIRIFYDAGLGREFGADELQAESTVAPAGADEEEQWRIVRGRNKWQSAAETATHPYPGTYPVITTGEVEWGGWRVPASEYALSPERIEEQARLIAGAPRLAAIVKALADWAKAEPASLPDALKQLAEESAEALRYLENLE